MYKDIHYSLACEEIKKKKKQLECFHRETINILWYPYWAEITLNTTDLYVPIFMKQSPKDIGGGEVGEYKLYDSVYLKQTNF